MTATTRDSIDTLLATLKARLAEPGHSLIPLLGLMSRFPRYSFANQCLIYAQRPDATDVRGYRAWQKAGRQVRKGEHGIAIYAPMRFKARYHESLDAPDTTDDGPTAPRVGFRVAYVFDVSQLEPSSTGDQPIPADQPATTPTTAQRATEQLKAFLFGHNVELEYRPLPPGHYGYTDGRRITCAAGQPIAVEFGTLVHETAHLLLHFPADGSPRPDLTTRETEAEAVRYLLCAQLGIDGTEASIDYIRAYRGTPDTLESSLQRIRSIAERLATELHAVTLDYPSAMIADSN